MNDSSSLGEPARANQPSKWLGSAWLAIVVIGLTILFKIGIVCFAGFDLTFDEAYYWHWSKNLDWCYFSKGPGIALLIRATTALAGDTAFGIRLGAILCSTATIIVLYLWGRRFFNCSKTALVTVLLFSSSPFLMGLGMLSTIDSPMVLLWTLASVALWRAIQTDAIRWWLATGLAVAVGTEFKFTMCFFLAAVLLASFTSSAGATRLRNGRWLIPFALVGLALVPILIWNMSNDWITLDHTVKKASTAGKEWLITWRYLAPSVGQQLGLMSPLIALGVAISIGCLIRDCWRRGTGPTNLDQDRAAFLLSVSAPILVFYGLLAFHRTVEANWLAPAYVTLVPAAAFYWLRPLTRVQQWSLAAAIGLGLLLQAPLAMGDALYTSGIPEGLARVGAPFKPALDVTNRVRGWKELGAIAAREKAKWEKETGRPVFLFVDHYSLAALVGFYAKAPDHVFAIPCPVPQNQFDVWALAGRRPPEGAVGICVYDLAKAGRLADPFFRTSHLDYSPGEYKRGDTVIRTYLFRVMFDYQGNDRWLDLARQVSPPSYK